MPDTADNYIHRIGRTGRAGCVGHAISLATPDQRSEVISIERLLNIALPVSKHPELPSAEFEKPQSVFSYGRFHASRRARRRR